MFGKKFWYGKEVEGRFSDVETVFVREEIPGNFNDYPHIYFTIEYVSKGEFNEILKLVDSNKIITLEVNSETFEKIPIPLFQRCHLIYRIKDEFVERLKETDTISIDAGWYRVMQITKCHLMKINPDSYKYDRVKD